KPDRADDFFKPAKAYGPLLDAWAEGDDGVLVAGPPGGFAVLRPRLSPEEELRRDGWPDGPDPETGAWRRDTGVPLGARAVFRARRRWFVLEPLGIWAWHRCRR
ncbi:MAG TPA: hypothetical protein VFW33_21825, partial [Gemmataceae bacterium]|nr:hypothetical protein [Gemmataceae bacterium]